MRLELSFRQPENILRVYVDGYDRESQRVLRWEWQPTPATPLPAARRMLVLIPGGRTAGFRPKESAAAEHVSEIHVFARIKPDTRAGFTLHSAALAQR